MLTLAKALSITQAIETANKDIQLLQPQSVPVKTVKMNQGTLKTICYWCKKPEHLPANCHYKTAK